MAVTVTSQKELDKALKNSEPVIYIDSPAGVWLRVESSGSSRVEARGSSSVEAWDSSSVVARGSSSVVAWGSSRVVARGSSSVVARGSSSVVAWGSSRVVAWGSSRVEARGSSSVVAWGSSRVVAWGSSRVEAWDSSRVVAWDSSRVVARGSSRVEARGSSRVEARGSSRVEARGSSRVEAWDSSRVVASKYVAIHLHSKKVALSGDGVVIDVSNIDTHTTDDFLAFHGVKVQDGEAILYKAVDADLFAGHGYTKTQYPLGATVTAPDWRPSQACGNGLHFGYRPAVARSYYNGGGAPRFLEVAVRVDGLVALGDKAKAESCRVLREVDIHGDEVQ
ncbi:hypothetical protein [Agromyces sp. NBRC 114283]|uniref:DUF7666 domain-containing protein n=1 Tax=Agromyces sp. NBRC 114283 TaxID=2994521 RepID=UPI0024A197FC|nr:hypothetical protein [Agromyces sp. NBRC 114283]GLU88894.1 hypothetical protein Agsp01_11490 [Agromyces sp. NBRC 114283]